MSWCRLEDTADENRKLRRLSHEAYRLYWSSVTYSRRHNLGGRMHIDDLKDVAARQGIRGLKAAIADLVYVPREYGFEAGCFEEAGPGFYQIHDHEEYNPPTSKERMRAKRARDRAANGDGGGPDGDGGVTSHPVTPPVTGDGSGNGLVTRSDSPRAQERAGYPVPVPEPIPVTTGLRPSVSPLPPRWLPPDSGLPDGVRERAQELERACSEFLNRPIQPSNEGPVLIKWAAMKRSGEFVALGEIVDLVRWLMNQPTRQGPLPGTLRYIEAQVLVLARSPQTPWLKVATGSQQFDALAAAVRAAETPTAPLRLVEGDSAC